MPSKPPPKHAPPKRISKPPSKKKGPPPLPKPTVEVEMSWLTIVDEDRAEKRPPSLRAPKHPTLEVKMDWLEMLEDAKATSDASPPEHVMPPQLVARPKGKLAPTLPRDEEPDERPRPRKSTPPRSGAKKK